MPVDAAIVEVAGEPDPVHRVAAQLGGELLAEFVRADDDRAGQQVFRGKDARQDLRDQPMCGKQRRRRRRHPHRDRARVERIERARCPAEQREESGDRQPAEQDVDGERAAARCAACRPAGKGKREDEQREDQRMAVDSPLEREQAGDERADRDGGIHRSERQGERARLMMQRARLRGREGNQVGRSGSEVAGAQFAVAERIGSADGIATRSARTIARHVGLTRCTTCLNRSAQFDPCVTAVSRPMN